MIELTEKEVGVAFRQINLEENYNFLAEDLVKLANGFIRAAEKKIKEQERADCIEFVRSLNPLVADALDRKRNVK